MKLILTIGACAIGCYLLQLFLPWWIILFVCFIAGASIYMNGALAFLGGFMGVFMLWFVHAYIMDISTNSILTLPMSEIFSLPHPVFLILVAAFIGGIAGGMAALSGYHIRTWMMPPKEKSPFE